MLVLAVHTVEEVTAKVPLSTIMLLDHVKRKDVPDSLKPRMVLPTAGQTCVSVWDAPAVETLQMWLDGILGSYCKTEAIEIQEDFAYGLAVELTRVRTTEKINANTRQTAVVVADKTREAAKLVASKTTQAWENVDSRLHLTERTQTAVKAVKSGGQSAVQKTQQFFSRVASGVDRSQGDGSEAANGQSVGQAVQNIGKQIGLGVSWIGQQMMSVRTIDDDTPATGSQPAGKEMSSASVLAPTPQTAPAHKPVDQQPQTDASNYTLGEEEELK
eukprot:TRINITY_DN30_c0_g1_i2.p2 TRINITY_DN30_c0_g1~~TRINITY_DN30_c0_g1_i2.p2  ORF type:complete len:312 (+),score=42.26 TRINITY_DN30_c0_g1_i2:120-938(+)